jgi:hypothetical protein
MEVVENANYQHTQEKKRLALKNQTDTENASARKRRH